MLARIQLTRSCTRVFGFYPGRSNRYVKSGDFT